MKRCRPVWTTARPRRARCRPCTNYRSSPKGRGWSARCSNSSRRASRRSTAAPSASTCTRRTRAAGEAEQRLYGLSAWREAPYYSERERAALAWAEVVTLISQTHASDEEYEAARAQRLTGYACIAFGILLLMVGLNAMVSFIRPGGLLGGVLY